jgi:hypothetical protein
MLLVAGTKAPSAPKVGQAADGASCISGRRAPQHVPRRHAAPSAAGEKVVVMRYAVVLVLLAALAGACGPTRDESGALTEAQDVGALELQAGDCFNRGEGDQVSEVAGVPCDEPHVYEVYFLAQHPDGEFPGKDGLAAKAEELCLPPFEDYVGVPYQESKYVVETIDPSEETWADGDRATLCVLTTEDKSEQTGSAKGSAA